ncbi:TonB-dependent receptor [Limnobacter litoralis]|nr:TonB-dependent receptor [Limnobacter litoralis]
MSNEFAQHQLPSSTVLRDLFSRVLAPTSDYGSIANLTPSYLSTAPNGDGFDAAKNVTLRGFTDNQFNLTVDGVPIADLDTLGHHSTSFFPAFTLDSVRVDRSPGRADALGLASIGGSINLRTLELHDPASNAVFGSLGSFGTLTSGLISSSGKPKEVGQTGVLVGAEHSQTNGSIARSNGRQDNVLLKSQTLVSEDSVLTLLYFANDYHFYNPPMVTTDQLAANGASAGFSSDPSNPNYFGYAATKRSGDFGYVKLEKLLKDGQNLELLGYSYSYRNRGLGLAGGATSSSIGGTGANQNDIAGRLTSTNYRTYGLNLKWRDRLSHQTDISGGVWMEQGRESSYRQSIDFTTGQPYNSPTFQNSPVLFDFTSELTVFQPYASIQIPLAQDFIFSQGLKIQQTERRLTAAVLPNGLPGVSELTKKYSSALPDSRLSWKFRPDVQIYIEWAKGAQLPSQAYFYSKEPLMGNQASPQTSRGGQLGLFQQLKGGYLQADLYDIRVNNFIASSSINGNTVFTNLGHVRYRGVELEFKAEPVSRVRIFGNYARIFATFEDSGIVSSVQKAGDRLPLAPTFLGVAGLSTYYGPWSGALFTKIVGSEYQGRKGSSEGVNYLMNGWRSVSLSIFRQFTNDAGHDPSTVGLLVTNLLNQHSVTDIAGPSVAGPNLVNIQQPRALAVSLSVPF